MWPKYADRSTSAINNQIDTRLPLVLLLLVLLLVLLGPCFPLRASRDEGLPRAWEAMPGMVETEEKEEALELCLLCGGGCGG